MLAITEYGSQMFSFRNNLQKNFIQCHKATPVGLGKLRNVVMHKKKERLWLIRRLRILFYRDRPQADGFFPE